MLADVDPAGADEWLTVQRGCLRAANLFFGCGQVEQARLLLADVRDRVDSQPMVGLVTALEGVFRASPVTSRRRSSSGCPCVVRFPPLTNSRRLRQPPGIGVHRRPGESTA